MKLIRKFFRSVKSKGGYTLIEVAAVVAITATLGAVVVPIAVDKTNEGKKAAANDSTKAIGGAITSFFKDTGNFPAASTSSAVGGGSTFYAVLRSGKESGVLFDAATHDPVPAATINGAWAGNVDVLDNHVTRDNPGGTPDSLASNDYVTKYKFVNWRGPYSEPFKNTDQWGHNFLVYVKAMHTATSGIAKEYGWIISAGPDGKLDTGVKDSKLQNDDIGYALFSAESVH